MIPVDRSDAPSLNFDSDLSAEAWELIEDSYVQMGLGAVQLAMAGNYGVVSPTDPTLSESTALLPVVDPGNQFHYVVNMGGAVTPKGQFTYLPLDQDLYIVDPLGGPLADGQLYVIVLRYLLVELAADSVLTRAKFYEPQYWRLAPPAQRLQLMRFDDYASAAPPTLYNAVALGVVRVTSNNGALTTTLTVTRDAYPFNRPWFSPVDVIHRSYVGTGTVTAANPHGQTLEDLDVGPVPLLQMPRTAGGIIAKDYQYPRCPGHLTQETIAYTSLVQGVVATLQQRPATLGKLLGAVTGQQLAYYYDTVLNQIIVLNPIDQLDTALTLEYTTATSLTPRLVSQTVRVGATGPWEAVISEGRVVQPAALLAEQDVDLSDTGGEVQPMDVYVNGSGVAFRTPQTLLCGARLQTDFPGGLTTPTATLLRAGLPRVLIMDRVPLTATVTVSGTDSLGQILTNAITVNYTPASLFNPDDTLPPPPATNLLDTMILPAGVTLPPELARQRRLVTGAQGGFFYAAQLFTAVTSIRLDNVVGGSQDGTLTLQAILDTRGCCKVAALVLADYRPVSLVDSRLIESTLTDSTRIIAIEQAVLTPVATALNAQLGTTYCKTSFLENFAQPRWADISATLFNEHTDDSAYYKSRAIPINIHTALTGNGYDLGKSTPALLVGHLPQSWRELLTPTPAPDAAFNWRVLLAQVPVFQWVWQYLHGSGIFPRLGWVLPQEQFINGGALRDIPPPDPLTFKPAAQVAAVQCVGTPEWGRLTFTRYADPTGAHGDDTYVFDGPRWVNGPIIDLTTQLPWSVEYTKSLYVELRGRDLTGYVAAFGRPLT